MYNVGGFARGGRRRGRGRGGRSARVFTATAGAGSEEPGDGPTARATESGSRKRPTAMELSCAPSDLQAIRDKFGSRAQIIINTALAFDAYLRWYYPYKKAVPFMCDLKLGPRAAAQARLRIALVRLTGEDDDGIRGDVVQTRGYQRRAHGCNRGL